MYIEWTAQQAHVHGWFILCRCDNVNILINQAVIEGHMLGWWLILITMHPPRTWQYTFNHTNPALQNTRLSVCVFKNVLPCVTSDLRDYISPRKLPLALCTGGGVLYHCGQHLKEVWKCVQLALYSPLSNPFWAHNGALPDNGKSSERGQLQAWPRRLSADFMEEKKVWKCVCVHVHMCSCVFEHSEVCTRSLDCPGSLCGEQWKKKKRSM